MKSAIRGAVVGILLAAAWLAATAGPELAGQSASYAIGWIGAPVIVAALIGAGIGGLLSLLARP